RLHTARLTPDENEAVSNWEEVCLMTGLRFGVGILQFVLLGLEDRRKVSKWILRLANDRDGWDKYPWGLYVWPKLYYQLRDANIRHWPSLYATEPKKDDDRKAYSLFGFTWAFKTWILESFRVGANDYYRCYRLYPRVGQLPVERLVPDETEARSRWWVPSRAYFDGRSFEDEQIPRHLNRNNYFEVPSEMYQEFEEQRRGYQQMKENKTSTDADDSGPGPSFDRLAFTKHVSCLDCARLTRMVSCVVFSRGSEGDHTS
nr:hypothetical protein [Tanacetum cinerariifolium]